MSPSTRRTWRRMMPWLGLGGFGVVFIIGSAALPYWRMGRFPSLEFVVVVLCFTTVLLLQLARTVIPWFADVLRENRELDRECLRCGHSLKGSQEPKRCPECGSSIDPDTSPQR